MLLRDSLEQASAQETPISLEELLKESTVESLASAREIIHRLQKFLRSTGYYLNEAGSSDDALAGSAPSTFDEADLPGSTAEHASLPSAFDNKYLLIECIGSGGMGEVYLAEQLVPVQRHIAIKVIRRGLHSEMILRRFAQERQALALMDHPHIARIFDGGVVEKDRPYFVMEYVEGQPITGYCDEKKLSLRERLLLFLSVCRAVQHAHHKGIIHRDLKPSNILVGEVDGQPMPKVIDFGVAKAYYGPIMDATLSTEVNTLVGTLEYMSPEQAELNNPDIDTRSDIYSLGVVLYELLAGVLPFSRHENLQGPLDAVLKTIREEEPPSPSQKNAASPKRADLAAARGLEPNRLTHALRGELDWMVMKCLEKDRDRRYLTAAALVSDIERYLHDEPVQAAPASRWYRLKKTCRRHWGKLVLTGLVFLILLGSVTATSLGMLQAMRAEQRAEEEAAVLRALLKFIDQDFFSPLDPLVRAQFRLPMDHEIRLRPLLDRAVRMLDNGQLRGQPRVEAALRLTVGKGFLVVGGYETALQQLEKAYRYCQTHVGENDPLRLEATENFAAVLCDLQRYEEVEPLLNQLLDMRQRTGGPDQVETLKVRYIICSLHQMRNKLDQAQSLLLQLIADESRVLGPRHGETLKSRGLLASVEKRLGKTTEAERNLREVLQEYEQTDGMEHPTALVACNELATMLYTRGDFKEAELIQRQLNQNAERVLGADHPIAMSFKNNWAACLSKMNKLDEAAALYAQVLPVFERMSPLHTNTLTVKNNIANIHVVKKEFPQAIRIYEEIFPVFRKSLGSGSAATWFMMRDMAFAYYGAGQIDKGMEQSERLLFLLKNRKLTGDVPKLIVEAVRLVCRGHGYRNQLDDALKVANEQLQRFPMGSSQRADLEEIVQEIQDLKKKP